MHIQEWWGVFADVSFKGIFSTLLWWLFFRALYSVLGNHSLSITSLMKSEVCPQLSDGQVTSTSVGVTHVQRQNLALSNLGLKVLINILCKKE